MVRSGFPPAPEMHPKHELMLRRLIWMKAPTVPCHMISHDGSFRNRFLCQVFPTNIFHQPLGIGDDRSHGWVPSPRGFVQPGTDT